MDTTKGSGPFDPNGFTISYKNLGTIHIDEFRNAVLEDIRILKEDYNLHYVKGSRIKLYFTNEYGEPVKVRKPGCGLTRFIDTHHYRPSCKDYDL